MPSKIEMTWEELHKDILQQNNADKKIMQRTRPQNCKLQIMQGAETATSTNLSHWCIILSTGIIVTTR